MWKAVERPAQSIFPLLTARRWSTIITLRADVFEYHDPQDRRSSEASMGLEAESAAVQGCIAALEDTRSALDQHYRWCDALFNGAHNEHGVEARKRVGTLLWASADGAWLPVLKRP
jgi:hypothetical protein